MKTLIHLVMNKRGVVRMTKNKPDLARDEIAIGLRLSVPDSAFLAPIVFADLDVPEHAVIVPEVRVELDEPPASRIEAAPADETRSGSAEGEGLTGEAGDAQPLPPSQG